MLAFLSGSFPVLAARNADAVPIVLMLVLTCGFLLVGLGIQALICWFLSGCLKAIPEPYRQQQPNMVWLMMIPLVNIVWQFFVYPKISDSFKGYFDSIGRTDVGDCGRGLAVTFCILVCCSIIPYLGACTGLVALVLWIILLVKFSTLKGQVLASTGTALPPTA